MDEFILDKKLQEDSFFIDNLSLCQLRLINNADFPWVILVPRLNNVSEIIELSPNDYHQLNLEILSVSKTVESLFSPDKLNIATIGNVVSQLHIHIVARYKNDKLFPKTVWGHAFNKYTNSEEEKIIEKIIERIKNKIK